MKSNAKQEEVKEEGSLATVVVGEGIYRTSVASRNPPAASARKEGTLQRCVALLETQLTRAVPSGWNMVGRLFQN